MERSPRKPKQPILTRTDTRWFVVAGLVMAIGTLAVAAGAEHDHGEKLARTMALTTFAIANLVFSFTTRDDRRSVFSLDTFSDRTFVIASLASATSIILATEFGFLQRILDTVELTGNQWLICIGAGLPIVVASEIRKFLLRRRDAFELSCPRRMSSGESVVGDGGGSSSLTGRTAAGEPEAAGSRRLAVLLAMAMFVLVVDTSLMNVSIAEVVEDLDTTVSGVQGAIALEALVSAAFILIGSKVGDLIGRKRAYVLGLLGYAVGALAMALAQGLTAIIIFWAIIGGLGASLLLPAMQSLIHGNFEGAAQKKAYALVGRRGGDRRRGRAAARRLPHHLPVLARRVPARGRRDRGRPGGHRAASATCPYTGERAVDVVGAVLSVLGMGGVVLGILVWQEGGESVGLLIAVGVVALGVAGPVARPAQARGQADAARSRPVHARPVPARDLVADAAEHRARRGDDRAADLPADGARVQRAADRPVARAAVADHVRRRAARRQAGGQAAAGGASSAPGSRC